MTPAFADIIPLGTRIDSEMTYGLPDDLREGPSAIRLGHRVLVPLGPRWTTGIVTAFRDATDLERVRQVAMPLDPEPALTPELLDLCRWIAGYYLCSLSEVLAAALPSGIHTASDQRVSIADPGAAPGGLNDRQRAVMEALHTAGSLTLRQLERRIKGRGVRGLVHGLVRRGILSAEQEMTEPRVRVKTERVIRLAPEDPAWLETELPGLARRAPKQAECITLLSDAGGEMSASDLTAGGINGAVIRTLAERRLVHVEQREVRRDPFADREAGPAEDQRPTPAQVAALEAILPDVDAGTFRVHLAHGVTGSGKTLVYIRAVARALEHGKGAILLIPEIALTPQTVSRFRAHFGDRVAVMHSRLSAGERYDAWRDLRDGRRHVAIGPRSAIFAPVRNLGLVIIDEEHEGSYKQEDTRPYYHARDVAVVRARAEKCPVILGSATPSVESYHNAREGKYNLVELPDRIDDRPLPEVIVANLKEERGSVFSKALRERIHDRVARGEQIILLQNRRGYAPFVQCGDCGETIDCEHCNVTFTFHRQGARLVCHYCGRMRPMPDRCPSCAGSKMDLRGVGTQKVEELLGEQFPEARVLRMDVDSTSRKGAHEEILDRFRNGAADILLGTQMIAKGLDFPGVTLVGVILADYGMSLPDFRASEKTFQLLTQVAGRAGRGERPGEVVIQTYQPDREAVICAKTHDYRTFYDGQVNDRQMGGFPPFCRIARLLFSGPVESAVTRRAGSCVDVIRETASSRVSVMGPAEAPLARLNNRFRWHVMLSSPSHADINRAARAAMERFGGSRATEGVTLDVDIDPVSVL